MAFLNADGTINASQMVAEAAKGGGSKLPDGVYVCRLLTAELVDAVKWENNQKVALPGKKRLNTKFTIMSGEHEKEELYLSYDLYNKSDKPGSTSGTVRLLTDLAAIGQPITESGIKLVFDTHGNMAAVHSSGPSVDALKAHWAKAFVGKLVRISSEMQKINAPGGAEFALRRVVGLAGGATETAATPTSDLPPPPDDEETPY